ncbi:MAG: HAD family phosphatase [archaeon]|nr:HAD family phosphatase [archaeon]
MAKKLIVVDLDGTLFDSVTGLSDKFAKKLNNLILKGLDITLATGRDFEKTNISLSNLKINNPIILTNGALMVDYPNGKVFEYLTLPHEKSLEILKIGEKYNLKVMVIAFYLRNDNSSHFIKGEWWDKDNLSYVDKSSYLEFINNPIISIQYCNNKGDLNPLYEKTKKQYSKDIHIHCYDDAFLSGYSWLEFNPLQAKKEIMLEKLIDRKGYLMKDLIYFGDQTNDIGALKIAGTACVVENAPLEVKKHADHIIPSNKEGGVIKYLEENFNNLI